MTPFDVEVAARQTGAVVRVAGELDIATTPRLQQALSHAESDGKGVVVDLTATEFADSSGMNEILRAYKRSQAAQRPFAVVCPQTNRDIRRVITLLGFDEVLPLHETLEEAVAATNIGPT